MKFCVLPSDWTFHGEQGCAVANRELDVSSKRRWRKDLGSWIVRDWVLIVTSCFSIWALSLQIWLCSFLISSSRNLTSFSRALISLSSTLIWPSRCLISSWAVTRSCSAEAKLSWAEWRSSWAEAKSFWRDTLRRSESDKRIRKLWGLGRGAKGSRVGVWFEMNKKLLCGVVGPVKVWDPPLLAKSPDLWLWLFSLKGSVVEAILIGD